MCIRDSASSAGGPGPGAQHGLWFSLCRRDKLTGNPMTAYPGGDTAVNGKMCIRDRPCTVRLAGPTCLAGDVIGDYGCLLYTS